MKLQRGFGAIAAIVILVILATLSAAIVSIGSTQQITSAQDVLSARAWQAAKAGNEWGLFMALQTQDWAGAGTTCDNDALGAPSTPGNPSATRTSTRDLTAETGFFVTVTCVSWLYNEGETVPGTAQTTRIYRITAVACPVAGGCPADASASNPGYVERRRVVLATN